MPGARAVTMAMGPGAPTLEYFEQPGLWDETSGYESPIEQTRGERLAELVAGLAPTSVLDAGAGNGIVANRLQALGLEVVALDHSAVAMRRVTTPKVVGDIGALPFGDGEFDLVLSSEVFEHLPADVFARACVEIARVARRWAVATVPCREDLFVSGIVCPVCSARSSPWRHMRAFAPDDMEVLLPGFRARSIETFGPILEEPTRLETVIRRELLGGSPWPARAICPQCGHRGAEQPTGAGDGRRGLKSRALRRLRRRRPKWILASYESVRPS